ELEAGGEPAEASRRDDRGAARRELALIVVRVSLEDGAGDGEADDGVAEELQPLVVSARGLRMLVEVAAVDERLLEQVEVANREPEALREGGRPAHRDPDGRRC